MDNKYNRHNRRKYSLKVHIVLVTKYRKQLLKRIIADDMKKDFQKTHPIIFSIFVGNRVKTITQIISCDSPWCDICF